MKFSHLFKHSWEIVEKVKITVTMESLLFGKEWEEEGFLILERCSYCGKERSYFKKAFGDYIKTVDIDYAKKVIELKKET